MSLPIEYARRAAQSMRVGAIRNVIAQAKAKQVLREVHELPANFPPFTPDLDERVTFVAYALLAAGCSMVEQGELVGGYSEMQSSADLLESAHRTEAQNDRGSGFHCLIGAMAFYACGQFSRAFVLIRSVEAVTPSGGVIAAFLRKDWAQLITRLNSVLLPPLPAFEEATKLDEWTLTTLLARAVSLAFEQSIAGEPGLLEEADGVLQDAMIISESASQPAFWWLARLLRLMLRGYGTASLWRVVPPFFGPDGPSNVQNYVRLLALSSPPVIELWQSQLACLQIALNRQNHGGVINLRTSAGKTRVAELAILQTLKAEEMAKVLYLAPFRSLAFELERTFNRSLTPLGYSVSHLYGGMRFSTADLELAIEAHVTIATPEKAKAMLRAAPQLFEAVKLIVVDEGHLLGGNARNVRIELFLDHLRLLARKHGARMLLLSAVLPNAEELAVWVGGDAAAVAKSNWKPSAERFGLLRWSKTGVKIEWSGEERCFNPHFIEFREITEGRAPRQFPATKTEAVAATAVRLAELGPVLIFAGQARWVPSMTRSVLAALGTEAPAHPWPETEWKILAAVCQEELGANSLELQAARVGVVCHSNKLPPQVRISVEKLMAKCAPRIIVATTTLGQGVNIGISSVIVATTSIGNKLQISKRDFWNICGRAGRAFVDGEGKLLFAIDGTRKPWQIRKDEENARSYFDIQHLDKVESGLLLVVRALRKLAAEGGVTFDLLLELVANNTLERCGTTKERIQAILDLVDDQLLALHVAYKGTDDLTAPADWVDDAFRECLAAIQEKARLAPGQQPQLMRFLKARAAGVLRTVQSSAARRAVVASGLPLSVGVLAFNHLDIFREMVDRYLNPEPDAKPLDNLVKEFEMWARQNARAIAEKIPGQDLLDKLRPLWLGGTSLHEIVSKCGEDSWEACIECYGFELPWLFHSVSQKLDKLTEEHRVEALGLTGLLVELGLPNEAAAKVFLAGVRSRTAAVELGSILTNASASVRRIRDALLDPATVRTLADSVSASTVAWLHLLSAEHGRADTAPPRCADFRLHIESPGDISTLHARQANVQEPVYLCSADAKFKCAVGSSDTLPFDKLANDPRYCFSRDEDVWHLNCRDPRVPGGFL